MLSTKRWKKRKVTTAEALENIKVLKRYFEQNMAPEKVCHFVVIDNEIVSKAITCSTEAKIF